MTTRTYIYISKTYDGYRNLSYDRFFLDNLQKDCVLLYLYVNENAVIIGKNQNAWKECNFSAIERDDVQIVRRHTGGGAVYHDRGNLNFSLIMNEELFDIPSQMKMICDALRNLGIEAEISGRNDILANGRKISGNAFGYRNHMRAHHGTLLINTDLDRLPQYLNVSEKKIRSKGIDSVRSRVCNLTDIDKGITVEAVRDAVIRSFEERYGTYEEYVTSAEELAQIENIYKEQSSWQHNIGDSPAFDYLFDEKLSFGEIQMLFSLKNGYIQNMHVYSDSLDTGFVEIVESALLGTRFNNADIMAKLEEIAYNDDVMEIVEYFRKNPL